jgi:hypothetical protein
MSDELAPAKTTANTLAIPTPFRLTGSGLEVIGSPSFEEWKECGSKLREVEKSIQWAIGDWLNYGERRYGEKYREAMEVTGLTYQTLADAKWAASRFDISCRHENLSFKHHREVAALPPAQADALLSRAESEGLSARDVRALVKASKPRAKPAVHREPAFLAHEECEEIAAWLRARRESWPTEFRSAFIARLRLILDEMEGADADH